MSFAFHLYKHIFTVVLYRFQGTEHHKFARRSHHLLERNRNSVKEYTFVKSAYASMCTDYGADEDVLWSAVPLPLAFSHGVQLPRYPGFAH